MKHLEGPCLNRIATLLLLAAPFVATAQTTCTQNCTGACTGFQSTPCSAPSGCTGFTVCTLQTGASSCYTFGSQLPCTACGAGGYQLCNAFGQPGACRPSTPRSETCNLCDDNANGQVDEGLTGACHLPSGCAGDLTCTSGVEQCTLKTGSTRWCPDCTSGTMACNPNGTFGTCQPPTATVETCNRCDDNKNGVVDDNVPASACSLPQGCRGLTSCNNGVSSCSEFDGSRKTGCTTCGPTGFQKCFADGGLSACRPDTFGLDDTTCDNCDDNWDNIVDNLPNRGAYSLVATCQGPQGPCLGSSQTCTPKGWSACKTAKEVCDGVDNNCDGLIDEAGVCRHDNLDCQCQPLTCRDLMQVGNSLPDGCGGVISCP